MDAVAIRFFDKIQVADVPGSCWVWSAAQDKDGYGIFQVNRKAIKAHRWSYEYFRGKIPEGLMVRHLVCDYPPCVNPRHLEVGTAKDNTQDSVRKNRHVSLKKDRCPAGHLYSGDNLYVNPNTGYRACRECHKLHEQERRSRRSLWGSHSNQQRLLPLPRAGILPSSLSSSASSSS